MLDRSSEAGFSGRTDCRWLAAVVAAVFLGQLVHPAAALVAVSQQQQQGDALVPPFSNEGIDINKLHYRRLHVIRAKKLINERAAKFIRRKLSSPPPSKYVTPAPTLFAEFIDTDDPDQGALPPTPEPAGSGAAGSARKIDAASARQVAASATTKAATKKATVKITTAKKTTKKATTKKAAKKGRRLR